MTVIKSTPGAPPGPWRGICHDLKELRDLTCGSPDPDSEILAWATGIYEAVKPRAWYALTRFSFALARSFPKGNLWLLPQYGSRLTYPWVLRWAVAMMFAAETKVGRRADWFLWTDDDIVPPADAYEKLRAAADPEDRPFVGAVVCDREIPYLPAVSREDEKGARIPWTEIPMTGTHPVMNVGLAMGLLHRSVFDRVSEPWFPVGDITNYSFGQAPDVGFCGRLREHGITPYVCADVECEHLLVGQVINRKRSKAWTEAREDV